MARNSRRINVPPAQVFEVLLDPGSYAHWVVGSKVTRGVDEDWPAPGAAFYHASGAGPGEVKDQTKVLEIEASRRLLLEAYFRPLGVMRVELRLAPADGGTSVTMEENPAPGTALSRIGPLLSPIIHLRNKESLRRLKQLAEQRWGKPSL
ncbi:MAG: SRPBCC family protein [Actinomycetota bacterium]|nr:SRPBCC family protein [Actinomycetota bacterium]